MEEQKRQSEDMGQSQETVKCTDCERTVLRQTAYEKDGKFYCCPDCYEGKTCDCQ